VNMEPDEDLPWQAPEPIDKWSHAHRGEFQPYTSHSAPSWLRQL